ncbi:MAG: hypothetical protein V7721_05515 [Porticoccaceae bacterium]
MSNIVSYISIFISAIALALAVYSIKRDRSKLIISWDMLSNTDRSKEWINISVTNAGRQPALITDVGYFDIVLGQFIVAKNKTPNVIIQPANTHTFEEPFRRDQQWQIAGFFVRDENGKVWENSKKSKKIFTEWATDTRGEFKHIMASSKYPKILEKQHRKFLKKIKSSPRKKVIEKHLVEMRKNFEGK